MTHRSFSTKGRGDRPAPSFDIDGETFRCRAHPPATLLLERIAAMDIDESQLSPEDKAAAAASAATALLAFIEVCMDDDEYARFRAFADDPQREIDMQVIGDLVEYLASHYGGKRPFDSSQPSADGGQANGTTSMDGSHLQESTSTPVP